MEFNGQISVTHIVTLLSVLIACASLLYKIRYDQKQERKLNGDKIKTASCQLLGYLERQRYIYLFFYEDIQPILTQVDALGLQGIEWYKIRDFCWDGMVTSRSKILSTILADKIEIEVINTWTVKKKLNALFSEAIKTIKMLDTYYYLLALHNCQNRICSFNYKKMKSSELGNAVRDECDKCLAQFAKKSEEIIFRMNCFITEIIEIDSGNLDSADINIPESSIIFKDIIENKKFNIKI